MRRINGVSVLVAVLVVIVYLITRPHVGTVWHVVWENPINSPLNSPPPRASTDPYGGLEMSVLGQP